MRALAAGLLAGLALAASAPVAAAGTPGTWTRVTDSAQYVSELAIAPGPAGGAFIAWTSSPPSFGPGSDAGDTIRSRSVQPSGRHPGQPTLVASGWLRAGAPDMVQTGQLEHTLFVAGQPTAESPRGIYAAVHRSGQPWAVASEPLDGTDSAVTDGGAEIVKVDLDARRVPWLAWGDVLTRAGVAAGVEAVRAGTPQFRSSGATISVGDPGAPAWVLWHDPRPSNDPGLFAQPLDADSGQPVGPRVAAPLPAGIARTAIYPASATGRTPIADANGTEWTIYGYGTQTATRILLWRLGAPRPLVVPTAPSFPASFPAPDVAATPTGRLWLTWRACDRSSVCSHWVARTNRGATRVGAPVEIGKPGPAEGILDAAVLAAGRNDVVDVFTRAGTSSDTQAWFHTQARPGLTVTRLRRVAVGIGRVDVRLRIDDAGAAVAGATIRLGRDSATTDARGIAVLRTDARATTAAVRRAGYAPAVARLLR